MGTKFKEVNTLSFIGNIGPKTERVWKEVDEEVDIVGCQEKAPRPCQHLSPLKLLQTDLPGDPDTKQLPIFVNDDVRMELQYCRGAKGANGHRPTGFCETQIQLQSKRITKTSEGDFELDVGDVLVIPPSIDHENTGNGPTTRLIVYTKQPVQIAHTYPVKQSVIPNKQCTFLKPTTVLDKIDEGTASGGKHFELVENADILIETTHRSDAQKIYHRGFGQDEVAFQLYRPARHAHQPGRLYARHGGLSVNSAGHLAPQHRRYGNDTSDSLHAKSAAARRRIRRAS